MAIKIAGACALLAAVLASVPFVGWFTFDEWLNLIR
jgi:hypothetical protein